MLNYNGDVDSTVNQRIKGKLVENEVICCDTMNVEFILKMSYTEHSDDAPFTYDDVENQYKDYSNEINELKGLIEELEAEKTEEPDDENSEEYKEWENDCEDIDKKISDLEDKISYLENEQERPQEVYEWWRVNRMLFEDLRSRGEVVMEGSMGYYWGRCCTGQAILLDYVISEIAADMGILEGQEYDWSKYM